MSTVFGCLLKTPVKCVEGWDAQQRAQLLTLSLSLSVLIMVLSYIEDSGVVSGLAAEAVNRLSQDASVSLRLSVVSLHPESIRKAFEEQGIASGDDKAFKPHLTFLKLSRAPKLRKQVRRTRVCVCVCVCVLKNEDVFDLSNHKQILQSLSVALWKLSVSLSLTSYSVVFT